MALMSKIQNPSYIHSIVAFDEFPHLYSGGDTNSDFKNASCIK